jgi:undecaprenyl-diphosphatase
MLAVLLRLRGDFFSMLNPDSKLLKILIVATLSTGITALPLLLFIKNLFETGESATVLIGVMLILTGIMLGMQRRAGNSYRTLDEITTRDMVFAGLAQGFSILPGISRSGTTLTILLMLGIKQELALKLSFLMSVPAVLGAVVLFDMWKGAVIALPNATIMVLSSLIVGYAMMSLLLRFASKVNFALFCVSLGGLTLLLSQLPILFF